jgi:hypothetical protein
MKPTRAKKIQTEHEVKGRGKRRAIKNQAKKGEKTIKH